MNQRTDEFAHYESDELLDLPPEWGSTTPTLPQERIQAAREWLAANNVAWRERALAAEALVRELEWAASVSLHWIEVVCEGFGLKETALQPGHPVLVLRALLAKSAAAQKGA